MLELILGGARSGKSRYAEGLAPPSGEAVYLATATPGDAEMAARIARHRADRSAGDRCWRTVEEPLALAAVLETHSAIGRFVLVDCLTLWLTNLLLADDPTVFARERAALLAWAPQHRGHIALVSNEVGQGVVPADPLTRRFVDESGRLHQDLARLCDRVVLVVAGLPLVLKDTAAAKV